MGVWFFATALGEFLAGQLAALTDEIARGELFHLFGRPGRFLLRARRGSARPRRSPARADALAAPAHARTGRRESARRRARPATVFGRGRPPSRPPPPRRKDDVVDHLHGVDVPDPYRWLEDADAPEVQRWTDAQNAATRRALDRVPGRAALEKRLWQLYEIGSVGVPVSRPCRQGSAPLLLHAPRRQAEPARALRARRRARRRSRPGRRQRRARRRHARARLVVSVATTARWSRTACPTTAARNRCCACATSATGKDRADADPARARLLAGVDARRARLLLHALPRAGRGARRRGEVPPRASSTTGWATIRRKDRKLFGDGRDKTDWPGVELSPDGRWLAITRQPGLVEERGLPRRRPRGRRASRRSPCGRAREVRRRRDARRSPATVHDQRRPARPALRGRSRRGPNGARWRELIKESARGHAGRASTSAAGWRSRRCRTPALRLRLYRATERRAATSRCPGWAR